MAIELPRDADGKTVRLDTSMMYRENNEQFHVTDFFYEAGPGRWFARNGSECVDVSTLRLSINKEGWEAFLDDLKRARDGHNGPVFPSCRYFNVKYENQNITCGNMMDCNECSESHNSCEYDLFDDIIVRIHMLLGDAE